MRRRLVVLALAAVLALGAAVAIWAALPEGDEDACVPTTVTVQDTETPRMMEYRRDCEEGGVPDESG
jgi:hypothetical protein